MEPKYIRSAAKHVRTRDLVLTGVGRTLLVLLLPLLGIAIFVVTDPSIQMVPRLMISAARHAQRVQTVHKEGLQVELTVPILSKLSVKPLDVKILLIRWEMDQVTITARWHIKY
jgi:hypothetical protein